MEEGMTRDHTEASGWLERQHECPKCGGELVAGSLIVKATFIGFMFAGFSRQHCWFLPDMGGGKELVVHTPEGFLGETIGKRSRPRAVKCARCGLTIFEPTA